MVNPSNSAIHACVYDGNDDVVIRSLAPDNCSSGTRWSESTKGYQFKDKSGLADGLSKMKMKAGSQGSMNFKEKGVNLVEPTPLPFVYGLACGR